MIGQPCRACGNVTDEGDRLHGDCRVRIRRQIELYKGAIEHGGPPDGWTRRYEERIELLTRVLSGEASLETAHTLRPNKIGKSPRHRREAEASTPPRAAHNRPQLARRRRTDW